MGDGDGKTKRDDMTIFDNKMTLPRGVFVLSCVALMSFSIGCDDTEEESLEIIGEYTDEWDNTHTISESQWKVVSTSGTDVFHIRTVDAAAMWLVA